MKNISVGGGGGGAVLNGIFQKGSNCTNLIPNTLYGKCITFERDLSWEGTKEEQNKGAILSTTAFKLILWTYIFILDYPSRTLDLFYSIKVDLYWTHIRGKLLLLC